MAGSRERTAVLVIRAWLEEQDGPRGLRARITSTPDAVAARPTATFVAASETEIVNVVRTWLRGFTDGS